MKLFHFEAYVFVLALLLSETTADGSWAHVTGSGTAVARGSSSMLQVGGTPEERRAAVKATVENYWSGEPRDRYVLLSKSYKLMLRRLGITNAATYGTETQPPERIWGTRTYQKVDVSRDVRHSRDIAQVVLLIEWEQEGYRGVMTYIFDLTAEVGQWRISNIVN